MKFAIIGKGKTGKAVIDSLDSTNIYNAFDSKNTPTIEMLDQADVVIVLYLVKHLLQSCQYC